MIPGNCAISLNNGRNYKNAMTLPDSGVGEMSRGRPTGVSLVAVFTGVGAVLDGFLALYFATLGIILLVIYEAVMALLALVAAFALWRLKSWGPHIMIAHKSAQIALMGTFAFSPLLAFWTEFAALDGDAALVFQTTIVGGFFGVAVFGPILMGYIYSVRERFGLSGPAPVA